MSKHKQKQTDKPTSPLKRFWRFLWYDDSLLSWITSIALAFIVIRFVFYPLLGLVLATSFPIVAVVSGSMEQQPQFNPQTQTYNICGQEFNSVQRPFRFEQYWNACGEWYEQRNITKQQFQTFSFPRGFKTGDIMIVRGKKPQHIDIGDILIFQTNQPDPIIHRVVSIRNVNDQYVFTTKGDFNADSFNIPGQLQEINIAENRIIGTAVFSIPFVGYIKIIAHNSVQFIANLFK